MQLLWKHVGCVFQRLLLDLLNLKYKRDVLLTEFEIHLAVFPFLTWGIRSTLTGERCSLGLITKFLVRSKYSHVLHNVYLHYSTHEITYPVRNWVHLNVFERSWLLEIFTIVITLGVWNVFLLTEQLDCRMQIVPKCRPFSKPRLRLWIRNRLAWPRGCFNNFTRTQHYMLRASDERTEFEAESKADALVSKMTIILTRGCIICVHIFMDCASLKRVLTTKLAQPFEFFSTRFCYFK